MPAKVNLSAYRDLLNEAIRDAATGNSFSCSTSHIGASVWTAAEKEALFRLLPLVVTGDLPALASATRKSESEVQSYLALLRGKAEESISFADIPAAVEVRDVEPDLNKSADTLAGLVFEHDIQAAKDKYYEDQPWLIDQEFADAIKASYAAEDDLKTEPGTEADSDQDSTRPANEGQYIEAATFLRPDVFLNLSKTLFMNSSTDPDLNWNTCSVISEAVSEPSIFRSAFEDFYNLVVLRTRRIVQATIFQAITRLRSWDSSRPDWDPLAAIRDIDVYAALEMLDMAPRADKYWVELARRCQVKVYSGSKKYADGRPGTKNGHELSWDEVEAELCASESAPPNSSDEEDAISEADLDEFMNDEDNFAEVSIADESKMAPVEDEQPKSRSRSRSRSRKRKRAVSPASFVNAENKFLEALDHNASIEESRRIADMLQLDSARISKLQNRQARALPGPPNSLPDAEKTNVNWRDRLDYEADWEHPLGRVGEEEFEEMDVQGRRGRKRRRVLLMRAHDRLDEEGGTNSGGEEEVESLHNDDLQDQNAALNLKQEESTSSDSPEDGDEASKDESIGSAMEDTVAGAQHDSDEDDDSSEG